MTAKPANTDLEAALAQLSEAHGSAALAKAFGSLQAEIVRARRAKNQAWGPLAGTYQEVMRIWAAQKAEGISLKERQKGLEKTIRVAWPQGREWHYLCEICRDYGLDMRTCDGRSCGDANPHDPHDYGRPCRCTKGDRFRVAPKGPDDYKQVGKVRAMTKFGGGR